MPYRLFVGGLFLLSLIGLAVGPLGHLISPLESTVEAASKGKAKEPVSSVLDINIAKAKEEKLQALPGIDESYAKKIVKGRPSRSTDSFLP